MSVLSRFSSFSFPSSRMLSGHRFSLPSISSHFSSPVHPSVISLPKYHSLPSSLFVLNVRSFGTGTQVGAPLRRKMTVVEIQKKRDAGEKISMVTAYTYPSAMHVDAAAIDVLLCGDSVAMVELGHDTTLPVTVDEMLYHCKAVARGASYPLLVGDMPFGSYEASAIQAYQTAVRFLKEGGMDCVKIEGGKIRSQTIRTLVQGGVAVMGHIGLTPQRISVLGGFRAQGRTLAAAKDLIEDALELQDAGCFAIVIECVPPAVAEAITAALRIPTIGIGAGPHCSGQVLVYHDLLGMLEHAHHAAVVPSFCKSYAKLGDIIQKALDSYKKDVEGGIFPGDQYSPYKMNEKDSDTIKMELKKAVDTIRREKGYTSKEHQSQQKEKSNTNAGTDETIKLY